MQRDHGQRTQRGNSRQNNFLGIKHPQTNLGLIVTDLVSAVEKMNITMERLERGQMSRWRK